MIKRVFTIFILTLILLFNCPVYSLDMSSKTIDKYTKKISNKFTRTYCNTSKFGISYICSVGFARFRDNLFADQIMEATIGDRYL